MARDWKPRLEGKRYCSPACGGGCLKAAHDLARARAKTLAGRLGRGWSPVVWENLGWHFKAIGPAGYLKVHPASDGSWMAFLGEGSDGGRWVRNGRTPEAAIRAVQKEARADMERIRKLLEAA